MSSIGDFEIRTITDGELQLFARQLTRGFGGDPLPKEDEYDFRRVLDLDRVFAASDGGAEDEGWLLTFVYDAARDRSDLAIIDAADFEKGPVARIHLPCRVPNGFHGSWIPD